MPVLKIKPLNRLPQPILNSFTYMECAFTPLKKQLSQYTPVYEKASCTAY